MDKLIHETIGSLGEYLPILIEGCKEISRDLQTGNEAGGLDRLPLVLEGLQWVVDAVDGIKNNGETLGVDEKALMTHFKEMEGALEIGDYVLLADLFEYEIVPILEHWADVLIPVN